MPGRVSPGKGIESVESPERRNAAAAHRAAARIDYLKNAICTTFTITSPTASTR